MQEHQLNVAYAWFQEAIMSLTTKCWALQRDAKDMTADGGCTTTTMTNPASRTAAEAGGDEIMGGALRWLTATAAQCAMFKDVRRADGVEQIELTAKRALLRVTCRNFARRDHRRRQLIRHAISNQLTKNSRLEKKRVLRLTWDSGDHPLTDEQRGRRRVLDEM